MTKISISRALVELGLLEKRIDKKTDESMFVTTNKDLSVNRAVEELQSLNDLIARYYAIKSAIAYSNAITVVNVNGSNLTVAEAIIRKNSISMETQKLEKLRRDLNSAQQKVERENGRAQERLDKLIEASFGATDKTSRAEVEAIETSFWKTNRTELIDPAGVETYVKLLDEDIDKFLAEVDLALSESNIRTEIEL